MQSFEDDILKAVGRTLCTGEEAKEKLRLVQNRFNTINIDLIFNFPFGRIDEAPFMVTGIMG